LPRRSRHSAGHGCSRTASGPLRLRSSPVTAARL
jgi:hypothetical protein